MTPEQRREMIVSAALPLVAEYGAAVTTSQIARAAGIGEATIFRVFTDKDEVLGACMAEALRPDHAVREIASIPLDQPLPARLTDAADALGAHLARMGAMAGALHASGFRQRPERHGDGTDRQPPPDREASMTVIREAVAELFEPDRDDLRLPAEHAAAIFLGLMFTRPRPGPDMPDTERLVEVFLHGALTAA